MNERRRAIEVSLRALAVPRLRQCGFKGSFPHFYRETDRHVDLLTFQFRLDGSSFVVEISFADPSRKNISFRPDALTTKLRVSAAKKRYRLGSAQKRHADAEWLALDCDLSTSQSHHFKKLALKVDSLIMEEGEPWWQNERSST